MPASLQSATFAGMISILLTIFGPVTSAAQLADDFTTDTRLNTNLWTTASSVLSGLASKFNSALLTPILNFDGAGMGFSGVNWSNEIAGVQTRGTIEPPFTLNTTVSAAQAHGNAYEVFLLSADLAQWLNVAGNLNPGNGSFFGVWVNYDKSGLGFLSLGNNLYSDPSTNSLYTIQIFVQSSGIATVALFSSTGAALGVQSGLNVGTGPFYLVLGQREGGPRVPGANVATWKNASLTPLTPAPVLTSITWTGRTVTLGWTAVVGAAYEVQYATAISPALWKEVGPPVTATTSLMTATDSPFPDPQRFYRVIVLP